MKYLILIIFLSKSAIGICQLSRMPIVTQSGINDSIIEISNYHKKDTIWVLNSSIKEYYHFDNRGRLKSIDKGSLHYKFEYRKGLPESVTLKNDSKSATNSKYVFVVNKDNQIVGVNHYYRSKNSWNLTGREVINYDTLNRIESFEFTVDNPSSMHNGYVHSAKYTYDDKGRIVKEIRNYKKIQYFYNEESGVRIGLIIDNEFGVTQEFKSETKLIEIN